MKKNNSSFINLGFSSIVMVFIMICLVTFATLSVLTAHSDYRLSKKLADKTTAYYHADTMARNMIEHIDNKLYGIYLTSSSASSFVEGIQAADFLTDAPSEVENIVLEIQDEFSILSYEVPISEVQTLHVSLELNYPNLGSECFSTITRWQTVTSSVPDDSEEYLNLYTGNE